MTLIWVVAQTQSCYFIENSLAIDISINLFIFPTCSFYCSVSLCVADTFILHYVITLTLSVAVIQRNTLEEDK